MSRIIMPSHISVVEREQKNVKISRITCVNANHIELLWPCNVVTNDYWTLLFHLSSGELASGFNHSQWMHDNLVIPVDELAIVRNAYHELMSIYAPPPAPVIDWDVLLAAQRKLGQLQDGSPHQFEFAIPEWDRPVRTSILHWGLGDAFVSLHSYYNKDVLLSRRNLGIALDELHPTEFRVFVTRNHWCQCLTAIQGYTQDPDIGDSFIPATRQEIESQLAVMMAEALNP